MKSPPSVLVSGRDSNFSYKDIRVYHLTVFTGGNHREFFQVSNIISAILVVHLLYDNVNQRDIPDQITEMLEAIDYAKGNIDLERIQSAAKKIE